ncbi:MAG: pyruvate dehydrogenase (acetyl-transferring), homodimeric type [Actinobacteria bacterium]|nr:pyruvate dehydrogenase (acetyl-transferring), homodimeric type [Actinomycetota bacterium]
MANDRRRVITDGLPSQIPDVDPQETEEWLQSLDAVIDQKGRTRARYLILRLLERARDEQVGVPSLISTDYVNTIPTEREPWFPGDEHLERRIRAYIRWNAAVMVHRANLKHGVGGHIATYASSAALLEVGFNHFFRGKGDLRSDEDGSGFVAGDQIYIQGHASPGIYGRAYLEGRLTEQQLDGFRRETTPNGLSSYPHPRLMPEFWEFPTVSMGLGPLQAIYQARFNRYLQNRGLRDTSDSRVWCFVGDGETGEPEARGALHVAAREELDNLIFIVNCNLQQLDGPVRGNGKIIQELESEFKGAGWNVIKVIWGRDWDPLLAKDSDGVLVKRMNETPDGQFQTYAVEDGSYIREHFFGVDPRLRKMVEDHSDEELETLSRGGHDYRKVYAAFDAATEHTGQPTVILAQTIKGWTLGPDFEARNATHQMKKLSVKGLKTFRDRLYLDIPDDRLEEDLPPYIHPGEDSVEHQYMMERRRALGGFLPKRIVSYSSGDVPDHDVYEELKQGSGNQEVATTMAFVRLLKDLMDDEYWGDRFVPIIPDEARTFGMDSLFPKRKIYSPHGQTYEPVDREMLLTYKEAVDGQILHEGITEAGCMAMFTAAGTSYATHSEPMVPFFIFYSMFGFQRVGDLIWAAGDSRARGFLLGGTAGRTTLAGEGLQHQDGNSHLYSATNPAVVSYDPAFAFEISVLTEHAMERMYGDGGSGESGDDVMFYLTVYNEPVVQPAMPDHVQDEHIIRGMYRYREASEVEGGADRSHRAQILTSGTAIHWALEAQERLAAEWDVAADVWSCPGWNELARDGIACDSWNRRHPSEDPRIPWVSQVLEGVEGPYVAVSDWMKAVPGQLADWIPGEYGVLGTDGFGLSDTRPALRRHFRVDAESVIICTLAMLAQQGDVKRETVQEAIDRFDYDVDREPIHHPDVPPPHWASDA